MAQAVIPFSFESYLQKKLAAGEAVTLNKIVLANIPDLDISQPIPRNTGLPESQYIVHEQVVDQVGKVNTNALAYSIVMDTQVGDFTFNAMYLIDKDDRASVGMIVWKLPEDKTATNAQAGTTGNSLVKSMLMEYDGAAQAAAITVDAATWQIDYSARLIGMDEDLRKQALDIYGHDAFIDDGFSVSKATNTDEYHVHVGLGYIGGLRAELSQQQVLTIANKPMSIYAVVSRQGSVLGAWQNTVAIRTSEIPLSDHETDGVQYYVAKIADINSDGSVVDIRTPSPADAAQGLPYNPNRVYFPYDTCTTIVNGKRMVWECYHNQPIKNKTPDDPKHRHDGWTDNSKPFYWIPKMGGRIGMPFYWLSEEAPEEAVMEIGADLPVAVYWRLAECYPHLIKGNVINTGDVRGVFIRNLDLSRRLDNKRQLNSYQDDEFKSHNHTISENATDPEFGTAGGGATIQISNPLGAGCKTNFSGGSETRPKNIARAMAIFI
ncbi:phage tail-collar fiber domain-containing protein [Photobacterium angustum]|uniref:Phage tail protein n=1 Tax=Photobacterium angustum TaxID=661 RepID=A0A855SI20_PHOAN|nr:phage tail protein [Photobacterium angustum]KJF83555.1 hypothetical protein UB36_03200 [Photobacterium damselae subsp. damselae]KJG42581.1 hypothetical protein UA35_00860 [Photobacterium angustum]KJG47863.1 hypothetical protein UA31_03200 [Photobacterium angustum]KJG49881.1 hypothetical protein UA30_04995 [Photobacterium angustum]KJG54027.1 hypothetical protein UA34_07160 [Photobacterium angustum]